MGKIGGEVGVLVLKLSIPCPLVKSLLDFILAEVEHVLSVAAASLLQTPSRGVVEIKRAGDVASIVVPLEVEALFDFREGVQSLLD